MVVLSGAQPANKVSQAANRGPGVGQVQFNHAYIGFVKNNNDATRMGRVSVFIPGFAGDPANPNDWYICSLTSPFAGSSPLSNETGEPSSTQTSYGMWFPAPDIDNQVVVMFLNGDPAQGVVIGMLYDTSMNHAVPGLPGSKVFTQDGVQTYGVPKEYSKTDTSVNYNSPIRPEAKGINDQLKKQGLNEDYVRGLNTSSARRESPSKVAGFLTKTGWQLFFDEHDEENFFRVRSPKGAQIIINDKHGFIRINTRDGNSWIEMNLDGSMDIHCKKSINYHTEEDFNLRAGRDINIEAGRNISIKVLGEVPGVDRGSGNLMLETKNDVNILSHRTIYVEATNDLHQKCDNFYLQAKSSINNTAGTNLVSLGKTVYTTASGNMTNEAGGTYEEKAGLIKMNC